MPWRTGRRQQLPTDWPRRRAAVRARAADRCEASEHGTRCARQGIDCDHIERGNDHSLSNLQWLCTEHHKRKTAHEAVAARSVMYARAKHPGERPPGLRT